MTQVAILALTIIAFIMLMYVHHKDTFASLDALNWGVGSYAAWGGSVAAGGLFQHDGNHGHSKAARLLNSLGV
jgi:hypothetical protein